jgi:hypothetical protein
MEAFSLSPMFRLNIPHNSLSSKDMSANGANGNTNRTNEGGAL